MLNTVRIKNQPSKIKAWYIVFINAFVGCSIASQFPQFSMTVGELSAVSGISQSILLTSDTIKSCGIVAAMIIAGFMYNRFGSRVILIYATLAAVVPQLVFPHLDQIWLLMILKFIQGSASIVFPVFLVIIMNWIEEKNIGLSTAVFNGIFYCGGGLGGTFAGFVISKSSWEMSYYALAVLQILLAVIWLITVRESPDGHQNRKKVTENEMETVSADDIGKPDEPKKNLLATSKLWLLAISFFATTWTVQAVTVDMPLFSGSLGFTELETGKLLTAVTIGMLASCLISGKTSDFFTARSANKDRARILVLMFGYILVIISVIFLVFASSGSFTMLYISALLITFGGSWGLGAFYSILPEVYHEREVPIVTGITGGIGDIGMPIAPLMVGVAFGIRGMWSIGWTTCAIMSAISILTAFILIKKLNKM